MKARFVIRRAVPVAVWSFGTLMVVASMLVVVPASYAGEHGRAVAADAASPSMGPGFAAGPLVVSTKNPRYFTIEAGRAADEHLVYLTGSHVWNNFHDGLGPGAPCAS